jgi:hypothetical protein
MKKLTHCQLRTCMSCSIEYICFYILKIFFKKINFFICFKLIFLMFLDHFDVLISKIIFKK